MVRPLSPLILASLLLTGAQPALATETKVVPVVTIRAGDRCAISYAKLDRLKPRVVAGVVGGHVAVGGAVGVMAIATKVPEVADEEIRSPEEQKKEIDEIESFFTEKEEVIERIPWAELATRSRENLLSYKNDRKLKHGLGEIFLHAEAGDWRPGDARQLTRAVENYAQDQKKLKEIFSEPDEGFSNLEEALAYLHGRYASNYCRDIGYMTAFYAREHCGNCQSNTKLVLTSLLDAGYEPPPGYKLGVQVYNDHVAPVLHETKTGRVIDLVANDVQEKPAAPIYEPTAVLRALMKHHKEEPGVSLAELLVAERQANGSNAPSNYKPKSNTTFEGGAGSYSAGGEVPTFTRTERGSLNAANLRKQGETAGRDETGTGRGPPNGYPAFDYSLIKAVVPAPNTPERNFIDFNPIGAGLLTGFGTDSLLLFKDQKLMDECRQELSRKSKTRAYLDQCLLKVTRKHIAENIFSNAQWQPLLDFISNPTLARSWSVEQLEELKKLSLKMNGTFPFMDHSDIPASLKLDAEWDRFQEAWQKLDEKIKKDPLLFAKLINSLPEEKRLVAGKLVSLESYGSVFNNMLRVGQYGWRDTFPGVKALKDLLKDESRLAPFPLKSQLGLKTPNKVTTVELIIPIEVTTTEEPSLEARPDGSISSAKKPVLRVPAQTLLALSQPLLDHPKISYPFLRAGGDPSEKNFKDLKGKGKFLTRPIFEMAIRTADKDFLERYFSMAIDYFMDFDLMRDPETKEEFLQLFGQEKFSIIAYETEAKPGQPGRKGTFGVLPDFMAEYQMKKYQVPEMKFFLIPFKDPLRPLTYEEKFLRPLTDAERNSVPMFSSDRQ